MADYYVVYAGTTYEVADFAAGIAKAKELGISAVLHVEATIAANTYSEGVKVVFAGGAATASAYPFGGLRGTDNLASTDITIAAGKYNYVFGGSYTGGSVQQATVRMTGGSVSNLFMGGWPSASGDNASAEISGGTVNMLYAGPYNGTLSNATVQITGGSVKLLTTRINTTVENLTVNMSGGVVNELSTGECTLSGNVNILVTGGNVLSRIYGGGYKTTGIVGGTSTVTVSGRDVALENSWIMGGGRYGNVTGKVTVNVIDAVPYHIFGGSYYGVPLGGVEVNVTNCFVTGAIQGGSYRSDTEGGITINVTGGTLSNENTKYNHNGWVIGGNSYAQQGVLGDIAVHVSSAIVNGCIVGGVQTGFHEGAVSLSISNCTMGRYYETIDEATQTTETVLRGGNIYVAGGSNFEQSAGDITATISQVAALGSLYLLSGGSAVSGDAAITVTSSSFGDGIYLEYGRWIETKDPDTGEVTSIEYFETEIDGDVAISLTDVTVTGNVWGKGRNHDLASFTAGKGITLSIAGAFSATGEVGYFDNISIAAGATLAAGTTTASAITATASEVQGLYTLATGFAAQASTVTVVNANGGTLGTVTLSESVTSGTFSAGGLDYIVSVDNNALKLQVGDAPVPPTPTSTVAEVILTITDPAHDYKGATGGWKVQNDQTVAWQDLTTLGEGYAYLGLGATAANKAMPDMYVYNAEAKYVAAYVTDDTGAITGFESIFTGESALMQVGLADFNGDGVTDLLLRTADGFVGYYANGAFAEVQGLGTEWTVAALGDVDGNGRADVIIAHEAGYVGAYLIGADGSISWADLGNVDESTRIVGAGDVNGDGTDDVIVQVGSNYYGAWLCGQGSVTGFFGIGTFDAEVQAISDFNADGTDDLLLRTAGGVVGAALITAADTTTWAEYGALGAEWSTKGVGIL